MTGEGDCYEVADELLCGLRRIEGVDLAVDAVACHGRPTGRGRLEGVIYSHAWIESGGLAFDFSNGLHVIMPAAAYRREARLVGPVITYSRAEIWRLMRATRHYGPWHPSINRPPFTPRGPRA